MNEIIKHYSVIAIAGPEGEAKKARASILEEGDYNKVYAFTVPDDYGEFPDTQGYEAEDWETLESDCEDPALFKYMTKCMDCVLEYVNKKFDRSCDRFPGTVEKFVDWPKVGGKMFFVTGHVVVESSETTLIH